MTQIIVNQLWRETAQAVNSEGSGDTAGKKDHGRRGAGWQWRARGYR
jgi:hypothetical protein